mgnify:CR=1 FL=1
MQMKAYIAGVGMTPFGNHIQRSLKSLSAEAILAAMADSALHNNDINAAYDANCADGTRMDPFVIVV